jgi:hypothetical protein
MHTNFSRNFASFSVDKEITVAGAFLYDVRGTNGYSKKKLKYLNSISNVSTAST